MLFDILDNIVPNKLHFTTSAIGENINPAKLKPPITEIIRTQKPTEQHYSPKTN